RTPRRAAVILQGLETVLTDRLHALLVDNPSAHGMRAAFRTLVSASLRPEPARVDEVVAACQERAEAGRSPSPRIDRFVGLLADHHPGDPGVVAALLLNPVTLQPGEAMYIPPGTLHAYLHGTGLEVMATSDNVLRAGLTPKKVDAEEVLQCMSVVAAPPVRVAPERQNGTSKAYYAPVDDYELAFTQLDDHGADAPARHPVPGSGPRILLGLDGQMTVESESDHAVLRAGRALFVPASEGRLHAGGHRRLVQASVARSPPGTSLGRILGLGLGLTRGLGLRLTRGQLPLALCSGQLLLDLVDELDHTPAAGHGAARQQAVGPQQHGRRRGLRTEHLPGAELRIVQSVVAHPLLGAFPQTIHRPTERGLDLHERRQLREPAGKAVQDALTGTAALADEDQQGGLLSGELAQGDQAAAGALQHPGRYRLALVVQQLLVLGVVPAPLR